MKLGFYFNPIFLDHVDIHSPLHPESPERIRSIIHYLEQSDIFNNLEYVLPKRYDAFFIKKTHCTKHFDEIYQRLSRENSGEIDSDTFYSSKTLRASLVAANTGSMAVRDIIDKKFKRAFCCIRPPGHHAEYNSSMGFCLFNNVAVTANYLKFKGFKRILIFDFDLHHGNGTQNIFYDDENVLFLSMHEKDIYPHNGFTEQKGMEKGSGFNINVPINKGSNLSQILSQLDETKGAIKEFNPDAVVISAGFDAHEKETMSSLKIPSQGFYDLTRFVIDSLPNQDIPIVSELEGGYNIQTLGESVYYHLKALAI